MRDVPRLMRAGQSRAASFLEAWINVAVGLGINVGANMVVLPMFGFNVRIHEALGLALIFTVISIARNYILRRVFNGFTVR